MALKEKSLILITNDDGIDSIGIHNLRSALSEIGTTYVVAPDTERSSCGHSITLHKPIKINKLDNYTYSISGTPADCVQIAYRKLLENKPDLVVSGINIGSNLGIDTYYSGTVAATREATFLHIPSFAISLPRNFDQNFASAKIAAKNVAKYILAHGLPKNVFLNVNLPVNQSTEYKITFLGRKKYSVSFAQDENNHSLYSVSEKEIGFVNLPGSDCNAVNDGFISITPIKLDCTAYESMNDFSTISDEWKK